MQKLNYIFFCSTNSLKPSDGWVATEKSSKHFAFEKPKPRTFRDLLHRSSQLISGLFNIGVGDGLIPADPALEMSQFKVYLQGELISDSYRYIHGYKADGSYFWMIRHI